MATTPTVPRTSPEQTPQRGGARPPERPRAGSARDALRKPRGVREQVIRFLVLVIGIALFVTGWRVTQIDPGRLVANFPNAQHILRALVTPDVFRQEMALTNLEAPVRVGQGTGQPVTVENDTGQSLTIDTNVFTPGEYVTFAVDGFGANSAGQLRIVGPNVDRKLQDVVTDGQGNLQMPYQGEQYDVSFQWPVGVVPEGEYTVTLSMQVPTGNLVPSETLVLALGRMWETILLALMGTIFGIVISVPLSFFGAANLMMGTPLGRVAYFVTRTVFNVGRSIEMLILAVIMVVIVGIGPFAGVMAIVLHSIGAMGKLYSEAIESIDPGPIEAVTATGASRFQAVLYAVIPQVVPQFLAFTMYRWDINVRMSTVIGLVGGGGIGFLLTQYMQLLQWSQAATVIWMIAIVVIAMDYASAAIRARIV